MVTTIAVRFCRWRVVGTPNNLIPAEYSIDSLHVPDASEVDSLNFQDAGEVDSLNVQDASEVASLNVQDTCEVAATLLSHHGASTNLPSTTTSMWENSRDDYIDYY